MEIRGLNIFERYRRELDKGHVQFTIQTEGILGEKLIEIDFLDNNGRTNLTQPIFGIDPLDVEDLAGVFARAAESFTATSEGLSEIDLAELTKLMSESSSALLTTSKGLNLIMDELQELAKKSQRLLDRVEQRLIDGNLFKVF